MEPGILVAESANRYQIISEVSTPAGARSLARGYFLNAHEFEMLTPERFVVVRPDQRGFYTRREILDDPRLTAPPTIKTYPLTRNGKTTRVTIPERED
jgi:hypothetical protein